MGGERVMQYTVSETFYNTVSSLIGIALNEGNNLEYEIALDLIRDLVVDDEVIRC